MPYCDYPAATCVTTQPPGLHTCPSPVSPLERFLPRQTDDWSVPPKTVNVIPLLDPSLRVVRMKLDPTRSSSLSEIVSTWRLSRLRHRGRITPGQHPFFYRLPISENYGYDSEFKRYPIEDFQATFNHNDYVVDQPGPGRVFIKSETRNSIFDNVRMPKHTLIFNDVFGRSVGERPERATGLDPQVTPDIDFPDPVDSSRTNEFPSSLAGVAPATRNDQLDVAAGHNINHSPWNSRDTNVYIPTKQTPTLNENRVLPPADNILRKTINTLNDDVLLSIFRSYRLDDDENWNLQRRWCRLIHVCRRWRYLIYMSPSHLDLRLLVTNGTPVADMLNHSPPLPLIINYQNTAAGATMTTEDEEGILLALQHRDRVRRIVLHSPPQGLHKFLNAMNENFPTLERLSILSTSGDNARLVMPWAFQAARLSHLTLLGFTLSAEPRSLPSTVSLVSLTLTDLQAFSRPYFRPKDLAAQLQFVPVLEELSISFSVPIPYSLIQMRGIASPITRAALPALKRFIFRGVSAYLEDLLARISVPCIRKFDVTLFNQLRFALPVPSRFIDATAELRSSVAKINFNQKSLSISISDNREGEAQGDISLYVQVNCKPFDWQVSSAAQICNALCGMLPTVEELAIDFYQHGMPPEWQNEVDSSLWCDLLSQFQRVKKLRVGHALTLDLSCALQPEEEQLGAGASGYMPVGLSSLLLPMLQELAVEEGCDDNAFTAFIEARQRVGRLIKLVIRPSRRDPGDGAKANASSRPPRRGGYILSRRMPSGMSLDIRPPGSYPSSPMRRRLRLPETAPISPILSNSSSTLGHTPPAPPSGGVVEQYLEIFAKKPPYGIDGTPRPSRLGLRA